MCACLCRLGCPPAAGAQCRSALGHDLEMPSLAYNTQVKESGDDFTLTINAKHILSAEEDSGPPTSVKGRPPEDIDIVMKADLVLSFAAAADGRPVSGSCLQASYCLQHVLSYLKTVRNSAGGPDHILNYLVAQNQHQLGLSMVSDCYVTDDDRPKGLFYPCNVSHVLMLCA